MKKLSSFKIKSYVLTLIEKLYKIIIEIETITFFTQDNEKIISKMLYTIVII